MMREVSHVCKPLILRRMQHFFSIRLTQKLPETFKLWAENLYSLPRSFLKYTHKILLLEIIQKASSTKRYFF